MIQFRKLDLFYKNIISTIVRSGDMPALSYNVSPNSSDNLGGIEPIGSLILWTTNIAPPNYLLANGMPYSRTQYPELFSVIGTTFGAGNGTTTFNVPNTVTKVIQGAFVNTLGLTGGIERVTLNVDNLPEHGHILSDPSHQHPAVFQGDGFASSPGGFGNTASFPGTTSPAVTGITVLPSLVNFNGNTLTGSVPFEVMNPFLCLTYIIRAL